MNSESISLKKEQQSSFDIAVKRLRKKVKDGDVGLQGFHSRNRGVVRLGRIPHGFYEDEMKKYFSQFGVVTRLRLARSEKTGNSRGFAFVEFRVPEVAKVVAETMNNYLMFDQILKARYIPPEEQTVNYFVGVSKNKVPRVRNRITAIALHNRKLAKKEGVNFYHQITRNLNRQLKKIKDLGIEYEFKPVDASNVQKKKAVLTLDESDDEITFKIPRNVEVVKRKSATGTVNKKSMPVEVEEGKPNTRQDNSTGTEVTQNLMKINRKGTLSKPDNCKMSFLGRGNLRGVKKTRILKVSNKVKLDDKKKIRDALKLSISNMKSQSDLKSMWLVKESV